MKRPQTLIVSSREWPSRFITMFRSTWNRALPTESANQSTDTSPNAVDP